ncbi:MAG: VOC family protein [Myxococcales bacterium]|nr:VOC family protein [Myxococcales bacterium]
MILKQSHSTLYVFDQERAKAFYTEKLGFEVREDATLGTFRWLTVAPKTQPDHCMILMALTAGAFMDQATVDALGELVKRGKLGGGVLQCDDIQRTYEELLAKGVEFKGPPRQMPYGVEAMFVDDSGNFFSLGEKR